MIDRSPLEQLRCLLLEVDAVGNIVDAVGGLDGVAGLAAADFVGRHAFDFVAPFDHDVLAQVFLPPPEGIPMNRRPLPFELTLVGPGGAVETVDVLPTAYERDGRRWIVSLTPRRLRSPAHRLADVLLDGGDLRSVAEQLIRTEAVAAPDDDQQATIEVFVVMNAGTSNAEVVSSGRHPAVDRALCDEATHRAFLSLRRPGVIGSLPVAEVGGRFADACADAGLHAAHIGSAVSDDGVTWWVAWLIDDPAFALKLLNADIPRLAALRVVSYALERDRVERVLRDAATTDALTGLRNHAHFARTVETTVSSAGDAVLFIDLDRFKAINDTHGHQVGDAVLAEVGRRISIVCESEHLAARIGGDEFAVLVHQSSTATIDRLAGRLEEQIGQPIDTPSGPLEIDVTIGVARSHDGVDLVELVRRADLAMLAGKRER